MNFETFIVCAALLPVWLFIVVFVVWTALNAAEEACKKYKRG